MLIFDFDCKVTKNLTFCGDVLRVFSNFARKFIFRTVNENIMKATPFILCGLAAALLMACGSHSRRDEIEARKAALKHKQDSALLATQQELAEVDSTLEVVKVQCAQMEARVNAHRAELTATAQELTDLTMLRLRRDSLQVKWDMLGAKIRYIRSKQRPDSL